ncbi:tetratricopeptide repeat protein [Alicyclobacillus ferrooxydans]|uniref:Tetratricopeptide repeat protein n=1 Tax=Alicyclobacillus ferrooxydans TaxID=471514 RepID=A0A0P9EXX5_9BACL|nr:hypothetical protein [Alicyclobacillus ferrooxydans]KPV43985.1 hypothetical protein AN477_09730 [Alicyclobacillus ferrooxydans]
MGWVDKVKLASKEALKVAREVSEEVVSGIESEYGHEDWYKQTKGIFNTSSSIAQEQLNYFSNSDFGKQLGQTARTITGGLAKLPVFSLTTDVIKARNGVDMLYKHLLESPEDPIRHIWLAEAMRRVQRDRKLYTRMRTVMDPSYVVVRKGVQTLVSLGQEPIDPAELKLLKNSYLLCLRGLKRNPENALLYDALCRLYISMSNPAKAVECAKIALLIDPSYAQAAISLARAYLALPQTEYAEKAAWLAIQKGHSYGYEILAEITESLDDIGWTKKLQDTEQFRKKVSQQDREAYLGPAVNSFNALEMVGREQWEKAINIKNKLGVSVYV